MAQSISSAQSGAISSGFLNGIGSAGGKDFAPDESLAGLVKLAGMIIEQAQTNLEQSGQVSSGALSDSFVVSNPSEQGGTISLNIEAAYYYDFQNKGVRGVKSGAGQYAFKTIHPSQDMVKSITEWLKRSGSVTTNSSKKHSISANETKNNTISEYERAYGVAQAIKEYGIKGTGYFDKAIKVATQYADEVLGKALAVDIINSLPTKLNGNNNTK